MSDCLFCKMAEGTIRPDVVYETDHVLAFRDINPQAKSHVLVIPKTHIPTLDDLPPEAPALAAELFKAGTSRHRAEIIFCMQLKMRFTASRLLRIADFLERRKRGWQRSEPEPATSVQ